jgi:hypothetical protein
VPPKCASLSLTAQSAPRQVLGHLRRASNARTIGSFLPGLTSKVFEKYGFSTAGLITDWAAVVGNDLAGYTAPERIRWPRNVEHNEEVASNRRRAATLVLRVEGARALDVQYRARLIIERINAYFGYAAVADLRIVQAPVMPLRQAPLHRAPAPPQPLTDEVAAISNPALRDALGRLGADIRARR